MRRPTASALLLLLAAAPAAADLAPGDPPLTQDLADLRRDTVEVVFDVQLTARQLREHQRQQATAAASNMLRLQHEARMPVIRNMGSTPYRYEYRYEYRRRWPRPPPPGPRRPPFGGPAGRAMADRPSRVPLAPGGEAPGGVRSARRVPSHDEHAGPEVYAGGTTASGCWPTRSSGAACSSVSETLRGLIRCHSTAGSFAWGFLFAAKGGTPSEKH